MLRKFFLILSILCLSLFLIGIDPFMKVFLNLACNIRAESVHLQLDYSTFPDKLKGHLLIDRPYIDLAKFKLFQSDRIEFEVTIRDALLDWKGSLINANGRIVGEQLTVDAQFQQFPCAHLNEHLPFGEIQEGSMTGRAHLVFEGEELVQTQAHAAFEHLDLDFIKEGEGSLSYNSDFGAKWELEAVAFQNPFDWKGRFFFKNGKIEWVESELNTGEAQCTVQKIGENWTGEWRDLPSDWLQKAGFPLPIEGEIDGRGIYSESGKWEVQCLGVGFSADGQGSGAEGRIDVQIPDGHITLSGKWKDSECSFDIIDGQFHDLQFTGKGGVSRNFDYWVRCKANYPILGQLFPLRCSITDGKFDFSVERPTWDMVRLSGSFDQNGLAFDEKCRLFGHPFQKLNLESENWEVEIELPNVPFSMPITGPFKLHIAGDRDLACSGEIEWKACAKAAFVGKIGPRSEFSLPHFAIDLAPFKFPVFEEGTLEGQGHVVFDGKLEADFDFSAPNNTGLIHFNYASQKGASIGGVDLHGPFDCTIEHIETDFHEWSFYDAQVYIPASFPRPFAFDGDLNVHGSFTCNSDFSAASCDFKDAFVPIEGQLRHLQDFRCVKQEDQFHADFRHLGHKAELFFSLKPAIAGNLILGEEERPMEIGWEYNDRFLIHSIEGRFLGVDASFRDTAPNDLIGSAAIDFCGLYQLGSGLSLKGRLQIEQKKPRFIGIVSGKDFQVAGRQFLTLFANADLSQDHLQLTNLEISDKAALLRIPQITIEDHILSIPEVSISDFRPSQLKKIGENLGEISPFVVTAFKLKGLKGDLRDKNSFVASGRLDFLNSFKRQSTIFDVPADFFSRIVGLDLELLIPVRGSLNYELMDGVFTITEIGGVFSENDRSEFFLTAQPATIDLEGNVRIAIQMKQFVLFKLTEAFLVSIDGKITDPQFHLQKKKRFYNFE